MPVLPQSFFARDALVVARDLLGQHLRHGPVVLRVTEVEAYRSGGDSANHCRAGRTKRNAPMWGPPGHAYVYLCYGVHQMLNLVTDAEGEGAAVLIRAAEVVEGASLVADRRGSRIDRLDLAGPGKVAQALGVDVSLSGVPVYRRDGLRVESGSPPEAIVAGPRVGIDYAAPADRVAPYRLADALSRSVSHRRLLI